MLFLKRTTVTYNFKQPITGSTMEFNGVSLNMKYSYRQMVNLTHRKPLEFYNKFTEKTFSIGLLAQFKQSFIAIFQDMNYPSNQ
jgi:hypothetical protein